MCNCDMESKGEHPVCRLSVYPKYTYRYASLVFTHEHTVSLNQGFSLNGCTEFDHD